MAQKNVPITQADGAAILFPLVPKNLAPCAGLVFKHECNAFPTIPSTVEPPLVKHSEQELPRTLSAGVGTRRMFLACYHRHRLPCNIDPPASFSFQQCIGFGTE